MLRMMWTTSLVLLALLSTGALAAPAKNEAACKVARDLEAEQKSATDDETSHITANRDMKDKGTTAENKRKEAEALTQAHTKAKDALKKADDELKTAKDKVKELKDKKKAAEDKLTPLKAQLTQLQAATTDGTEQASNGKMDAIAKVQAQITPLETEIKGLEPQITAAEAEEKTKTTAQEKAKGEEKTASDKAKTGVEAATKAKTEAEAAVKAETAAADKRKASTGKLADSFRAKSNQAYRCPDFKVTPLALALSHTKYTTFKKVKDAMLARIKDDPQKQLFGGQAKEKDLEAGKVKSKDELGNLLGKNGLGGELTSRDTLMKNLDARMQEYAKTRQGVTDNLGRELPKWEPVKPVDQGTLDNLKNPTPPLATTPRLIPQPLRNPLVPPDAVWNSRLGQWEKNGQIWSRDGVKSLLA